MDTKDLCVMYTQFLAFRTFFFFPKKRSKALLTVRNFGLRRYRSEREVCVAMGERCGECAPGSPCVARCVTCGRGSVICGRDPCSAVPVGCLLTARSKEHVGLHLLTAPPSPPPPPPSPKMPL